MAETFLLRGSVSANSFVAITPPAGKAYVIGPGFANMGGSLRLAYRDYMANPSTTWISSGSGGYDKPFWVVHSGGLVGPALPPFRYYTGTNEGGNLNGNTQLFIVNQSASAESYFITGPVTTLSDEGIVDSFTCGIWGALGGTAWRTDAVMPSGYCYLVSGVFHGESSGVVKLLASDNSLIMNLPKTGKRFWLWSEQQLKFETSVASTNYGGGLRIVRYAENDTLDEYTNRISYNQMVAAGSYIDLVPPSDETWYVDLHNWPISSSYLKLNGTTGISDSFATSFQLSSGNWMRFHNADGSGSRRLFITGTRVKD